MSAEAAPIRLSISCLHLSLARKQDPETPERLPLRQDFSTNPFPVQNHGLGCRGDHSHPSSGAPGYALK